MSDQQMPAAGHVSPFESIRRTDDEGYEYWSARDLTTVLGYTNWRNFKYAIDKAMQACLNSQHETSNHFDASIKMVQLGSGAQRELEDVHLSRYACYLIVQNADPSKEIVALGQTYFAVQTRRAEIAGDETEHNRLLAAAAKEY